MTRRQMLRAQLWLGLVLVIACRAWPAAGESLTVSASAPSPGQCALMMARDLGLFRTQDLDVDLVFFDSGTEGVQALVGGRVPIGAVGASAVVNAGLAGADAVLIAGFVNRLTYSLVVVPEIATPADLKGKAIGVNRFGSSNDFAARLALTRLGLQPDRDVTLLQLGSAAARLAALQSRGIQGAILEPASLTVSRRLGFPELVDFSRLDVRYPLEGVAVSRSFARERPETVRRFLRGLVLGIHAFRTRPDDARQCIRTYLKVEDPEVLATVYGYYSRLAEQKPYVPLEGVRVILDEVALRNPQARAAKPEDFVDTRLLKEIDDSGFIDRLYR
jgi:ABC-type nitrate/sulfonate/bicarbonate transport system substrate-binding protein